MSNKKETTTVYKAVLWSDGSAKPRNPGFIGWGVHGYVHTDNETKKGAGHPKVAPTPSGYVLKSDKPVPLDVVSYYDCAEWTCEERTNNTAEVAGGACALNYAATIDNLKHVTVYSDSKYFVKGANDELLRWSNNGWLKRDGSPVANIPEWQSVLSAVNKLQTNGTKIRVEWVKGHADNFGNIQADSLASIAGTMSLKGDKPGKIEVITPAQGYWKGAEPRHPLFCVPGMFFTTDPKFNKEGEYYLSSQVKSDEFIGNADIQASYGYLVLKEPDARVEMVRRKTLELTRSFTTLMLLRLDRVYDKAVVAAMDRFGSGVLQCVETTTNNVHFVNEDAMAQPSKKDGGATKRLPIVEELYPPMLAMRLINNCSVLKGIALKFEGGGVPEFEDGVVTDITSLFYETTGKGDKARNELKKSIQSTTTSVKHTITLQGKDIELQQVLGLHVPSRNALKRIESLEPQVFIVTLRCSNEAVRYYCVIRTNDSLSAWCSAVANLKLIQGKFE